MNIAQEALTSAREHLDRAAPMLASVGNDAGVGLLNVALAELEHAADQPVAARTALDTASRLADASGATVSSRLRKRIAEVEPRL